MTPIQELLTDLSTRPSVQVVALRSGIELEEGGQACIGEIINVRGDIACSLLRRGAVNLISENGLKVSASRKPQTPKLKRETR